MRVGIIGMGRLGEALTKVLRTETPTPHLVFGFDKDPERVRYSREKLKINCDSGFSQIAECEIVFILVDTTARHGYNTQKVESVLRDLADIKGSSVPLIVLSSTVPPAFFSWRPEFLSSSLRLVYHPFFVAQGTLEQDILSPQFVLIGQDSKEDIAAPLRALYQSFGVHRFYNTDFISAALVKLAINTFLATKITYTNVIGDLAISYGVDPQVVLDVVASDQRVGQPLTRYGFGYGGPCLPVDVKALGAEFRYKDLPDLLLRAIVVQNHLHTEFQIAKAKEQIKDGKITLDGIGFKEGSDILTNSPRMELALALQTSGIHVTICESSKVIQSLRQIYGERFSYQERPCT